MLTGDPAFLQLVERVWEGTGAVLATDVLRAAGGSDEPLKHWTEVRDSFCCIH